MEVALVTKVSCSVYAAKQPDRATHRLPVIAEAFADRGYRPDGQLVSRREPGAVLHDPDEVAALLRRMIPLLRARTTGRAGRTGD